MNTQPVQNALGAFAMGLLMFVIILVVISIIVDFIRLLNPTPTPQGDPEEGEE